ncbi:hypothetical protein [Shewanella waksmanii]|uniref:hypothetical protein n=1 Tax=Shewanella waksmanii TaxID=213783 RepID=UPI003734E857
MQIIDWIAVLGALAWSPHLVSIIKKLLTKPKVRVITQKNAEIGFTTLGPIFNLRVAFSVENKDLVISGMNVIIKHEAGSEHHFEWQGIVQQVGKMTSSATGVMPFEKELSVLAMKLNQKEIEERFIRCQEVSFITSKNQYISKATKKASYLKSEERFDAEGFLREQEMIELYQFNKQAFPWKAGKYTARIELTSPEKFIALDNDLEFLLTPIDIEELKKNCDKIEESYKREIVAKEDNEEELKWIWRAPNLLKI